jgi:hypothetical protein
MNNKIWILSNLMIAERSGLRIKGCQCRGRLASVGEAVLKTALDHVVVVQPAVRLHHFSLTLTEMLDFIILLIMSLFLVFYSCKMNQLQSNSVVTNSLRPAIFVRYNRGFIRVLK